METVFLSDSSSKDEVLHDVACADAAASPHLNWGEMDGQGVMCISVSSTTLPPQHLWLAWQSPLEGMSIRDPWAQRPGSAHKVAALCCQRTFGQQTQG